VLLHLPSPSFPTFSDGDPLHTVSKLQHCNKHSHMLCELNCTDGTPIVSTAHWYIPHDVALYNY
jgi:hypothetical protein